MCSASASHIAQLYRLSRLTVPVRVQAFPGAHRQCCRFFLVKLRRLIAAFHATRSPILPWEPNSASVVSRRLFVPENSPSVLFSPCPVSLYLTLSARACGCLLSMSM
ncbi:hypothetical protein TRVL_06979 [Trypanosoma vivax]|nr:hypothetical protein TRVL_06979 [Trypanosoma vivax]